ncbi:hypothetical protein E1B28_007031 [Marasmius oreades]|uniref:Uncharacterized protein n=1 Tax=Marasmius oreades TaxID=181124 RepID=A0A9P7UTM0_9AGAR|nr:uncharacterized protein E1B28_007031 [Marasmius oreades]KAG7093350.1 hypothetical protein E1B28_007031 [Marasmius oreades]
MIFPPAYPPLHGETRALRQPSHRILPMEASRSLPTYFRWRRPHYRGNPIMLVKKFLLKGAYLRITVTFFMASSEVGQGIRLGVKYWSFLFKGEESFSTTISVRCQPKR